MVCGHFCMATFGPSKRHKPGSVCVCASARVRECDSDDGGGGNDATM